MWPRRSLLVALLALPLPAAAGADGSGPDVLRVGHWVRLKGRPDADGAWVASSAELREPEKYEVLVGTVGTDEPSWERFELLGVPISVPDRVANEGLPANAPAGLRLKVEGYYRGPRKFSAREVSTRGRGRESVIGRIDELERFEGGWRVRVMNLWARLPFDLEVEHELDLRAYPLIGRRGNASPERAGIAGSIDEDDEIPESVRLAEDLYLGGQIEWRSTTEDEYDLDETDSKDRVDHELSARVRARWVPHPDLQLVATLRGTQRWRRDEDDGRSKRDDARLSETYLWWANAFGTDLDLIVGRQDFDDPREWIYDQDLDAARVAWSRPRFRAELSVSTTLSDGSPRDEDTTNLVAYVSNNDEQRHLAGWVVDRRDDAADDDSPIHFGVRALGEWLPEQDSWAELAVVKGYRGNVDYDGYGWDLGTTWAPGWMGPFDVTAGWAFGSGDDTSTLADDEGYQQTGFQDNNGRFGGVTSFRYYGELFDPELSNLSIFTLGLGARLFERTSLDLVWHAYQQDVAAASLRDSDLDANPSGMDRELGTELDLVLGVREWERWDVEVVAAWFRPGDAFPGMDDAFLGKVQLRFKF